MFCRPILALALAFALVELCLTRTARSGDVTDDRGIQGTWLPSSAELSGSKYPDDIRKSIKLEIHDDKYTVTVGDAPDKGTIKLNPSANPKEMDIIGADGPNQGKTFLCIYDLSGDKLKICYDLSCTGRPTEFKSTTGTKLFLVTYERKKD
jgi:uncharacterized protein (TIGR03067 family)